MANHRKLTDGGPVYFNRFQLVTVAVLFGIASVAIFFLGILIGQSIEERKLLREEELVKVPVNANAKKEDDITFYETLTKPEASADPKTPAGPKAAEKQKAVQTQTPWTLQVAALRRRATADSMAADLKKRGYRAYVTPGDKRKTFYRVRVGRYRTRREAMEDLLRLKNENYQNAMITRNP